MSNFDKQLGDAINGLDKSITPERELWQGIEKAIENVKLTNQTVKTNWYWSGAIAACLLLVIVSVNQFQSHNLPLIDKPMYEPNRTDPVLAMTEFFNQHKNTLLVQYKTQPAASENWQAQLAELERAEQSIRKVLEVDPDNAALIKMLAQIYQQQLDLINKVHQPIAWQSI